MTNEQILKEEFNLIRIDLVRRHEELGMKASGKWIEGLEVDVRGLTGILRGEHYTEQLVNGREPGKMPPVEAILQWILNKGIRPDKGTVNSLAWAIAKKIAKEGTEYYKEGGTDLVDYVITPERVQRILDRVSEFNVSAFTTELTNVYKDFADA